MYHFYEVSSKMKYLLVLFYILGKLIDQLDEEESEEEIVAPSSVFSNHSAVSSRASPSHREPGHVPPMFSPDHPMSEKDAKPGKADRKGAPATKTKKARRKSDVSAAEPILERLDRHPELVHSDSKGFLVDRFRPVEAMSISSRSGTGVNIGDEAPIGVLESPNGEDLTELVALQRRLMTIKDPAILVKVVMLIQDVGKFKIGESTFDFDLCTLDSSTVQQIRTYLSQS